MYKIFLLILFFENTKVKIYNVTKTPVKMFFAARQSIKINDPRVYTFQEHECSLAKYNLSTCKNVHKINKAACLQNNWNFNSLDLENKF